MIGAEHINIDDAAEGCGGLARGIEQRRDQFQPGVVDQHIDAADLVSGGFNRGSVGDVAFNGPNLAFADTLQPMGRAEDVVGLGQDDEIGAAAGEGFGNAVADAAAGARHQHSLPAEIEPDIGHCESMPLRTDSACAQAVSFKNIIVSIFTLNFISVFSCRERLRTDEAA